MEHIESISIIWGARSEDLDIASEKIFDSLQFISKNIPDIYRNWYELGYSKEESLNKNIEFNLDTLKILLEKNTDKKNPNLGTRISLWNGLMNTEKEASFSAKLNSLAPKIKNNFVLRFPENNNLDIIKTGVILEFLFLTFNGENIRINGKEISYNDFQRLREERIIEKRNLIKEERKNRPPGSTWSLLDDDD